MTTVPTTTVTVIGLGEDAWLSLDALASAADTQPDRVRLLVDEGLLAPAQAGPDWRFGGDALARLRRIQRLQADFDASLPSVALLLDLLDERDRLRGLLRRAGLQA